MSYTALITFKGNKPVGEIEFSNAWGGAARIWDPLFERYVPKRFQYDSWILDKGERLWELARDEKLPVCERAVHAFTFDLAYVSRMHFLRLATDLRSFDVKHPRCGVNHLPAWEAIVMQLDADAVALYGTSVSENPWSVYSEEKDAMVEKTLDDGVRGLRMD